MAMGLRNLGRQGPAWILAAAKRRGQVWLRPHNLRQMATAYFLIGPALVLFTIFTFIPMVETFVMSFTNRSLVSTSTQWVGWYNYREILGSSAFWQAFFNTTIFAIQVLPLNIACALGLALLVHGKFRGVGWYRTVFFAPVVTSMVAVSIIWMWIFNPSNGLINAFLTLVHLPTQAWIVEPHWALEVLVLLRVWKGIGANMIIFLAGLNAIPQEYQEAAVVDGADRVHRFWSITWPLLRPTTFYILVLGTISLFQAFSEMYVMTQGGPLGTTTTVVYLVFNIAFQEFQLGYGAAIAATLFVVIFGLSLVNVLVVQRRMRVDY